MAKVSEDGVTIGTHLWIVSGRLTPLLEWRSAEGRLMQLQGKTFDRPETGSQWFDQLAITSDRKMVVDVTAEMTHTGTARVMLDGKPVGNLSSPDASCPPLPIYENLPGRTCFASADHPVVVLASKRKGRENDVGGKQA